MLQVKVSVMDLHFRGLIPESEVYGSKLIGFIIKSA